MRRRFLLAPLAAQDLAAIWRYLNVESGPAAADRVEAAIRDKIAFLARRPGAGHAREDLTRAAVRFFPIYSYLIVYRPETKPLQIVRILHGRRDVAKMLRGL